MILLSTVGREVWRDEKGADAARKASIINAKEACIMLVSLPLP